MLSLITAAVLPMCFVVVATDAGNPGAVVKHEMAHCWGWVHPEVTSGANRKINSTYRAYNPPLRYRLKGAYPSVEVRFELSAKVLKLCDGGSAYGCQWGGLQK